MSLLFSTGAIAGSAAKGAPGMVLIKPTSIAHSGTSASIGANGQVTFTAVTSLSLNGVFSADFDNYMVSCRMSTSDDRFAVLQLRASGSNATGSNYTGQRLEAFGTGIGVVRSTRSDALVMYYGSTQRNGFTIHLYGPYLSQPTALRSNSVSGYDSAGISDYAVTHSLSTSYDGFTLLTNSVETITGALQVYGVRS